MCVVSFDYGAWTALFPELSSVSEPLASAYFDVATTLLDNTDCSTVVDCKVRASFFNFLVAHLAALFGPTNNGQSTPAQLVGRIQNAAEGSVSVGMAGMNISQAAEWYAQTKYGFLYWTMTAAFRTMHYRPSASGPAPMAPGVFGIRRL